jgi:hypothetical protein
MPKTALWPMANPEFRWASVVVVFVGALVFGAATVRGQDAEPKAEPARLAITEVRLGFDGVFKLGCWTQLEVSLRGGAEPATGRLEVTTRDSDGVPTTASTLPDRPVGVQPGETTKARLFVRCGQDNAPIAVRFVDDQGEVQATREFEPAMEAGDGTFRFGLPATSRLAVTFGLTEGLSEFASNESLGDDGTTHIARVSTAGDLPVDWQGYEGVAAVVMTTTDPQMYRPLAANPQRIAALGAWIESGGRLVIFCGADAGEVIGPEGPLSDLVPGRFDTLVSLRESLPLEVFSGAHTALNTGQQLRIQVPRLIDVRGRILAHAGPEPTSLPLVVRARRGLGEVTFVAVDPQAAPIASWSGRGDLIRQALEWPAPTAGGESGSSNYGGGDLVDQLRTALDQSFAGIQTAPFALVAGLVILYILLIGPGDYFFVKHVLKRMELTWVTFPLIVLGVCAGAYWLAYRMKGDQLRVNQVEVVDVDLAAGDAYGMVWTHFFSPRVDRYDLALAPHFGEKRLSEPGRPGPGAYRLVGWLGSTGYGLGGMRGQGTGASLFDRGYAFAPPLDAVLGLPVQEWSTKTLVGRWKDKVDAPLEASLSSLPDNLLSGTIANRSGVSLDQCVLLHGRWAYLLPTLADGQSITIDESLQPRTLATALETLSSEEIDNGAAGQPSARQFDPYSTDVPQIVKTLMFYDASGGSAYASSSNQYQPYVDLSPLLDGDQAILLARVDNAEGSQWVDGDEPLAGDQDRRWVYYRFIISLEE